METGREEAAPTFPTWRRRLEQANESELHDEVARFTQVLKAVGTPMIDGASVYFVYYDHDARQVAATGEFNQWDRRGMPLVPLGNTGIFYRTMDFQGPVRVEYKLIVDGEWVTDPFCPNNIDNGIGEKNSYFVVGDLRDPPELEASASVPRGRVQEFEFESEVLHNQRRVYVYMPANYQVHVNDGFPVLYVHDGGEYLTRARLPTILDNLIHNQEIPPLMAVMVDPVDRLREYWANEEYARFTETELIPHIDKTYRTLARREGRGVIGASMGGLISTYLGLSRPHLFSKVGGQSSALFLMDRERGSSLVTGLLKRFGVTKNPLGEAKRLSTLVAELRTPLAFYFDVGKYEPQFIPAHQQLVPLLEAQGCPCLYQELIGGHNWTSWRAHLKDMLTFLWGEAETGAHDSVSRARDNAEPAAREAASLSSELDRRFVRFFNGWEMFFRDSTRASAWSPAVESIRESDRVIFHIALPDVDPRAIGLLLLGHQLILKGVRTTGQATANGDSSPSAQAVEWFEHSLPVPEGTTADLITACYCDGRLEISVPTPPGIVARRIPIEVK
jgi:enterochelin esterase-like enzyme/HSP20 family molecular chaperone IbpA